MKKLLFIIALAALVIGICPPNGMAAKEGHCYKTKNCSGDALEMWVTIDVCAMMNGQSWKIDGKCVPPAKLGEIRNAGGSVPQINQQSSRRGSN